MYRSRGCLYFVRISLLAMAWQGAPAQEPPASAAPRWVEGRAIIGAVAIDPEQRVLVVSGWVNQVSGPIELMACGAGGKTHESVFVLPVNPLDLQTGLLLLGCKSGEPMPGLGQGAPKGDALDVLVEWVVDGQAKVERAERFALNEKTGKPLPRTKWIYTGSVIENGEFKALAEESLLATYWDPWAIINIGHPCGSDDEQLSVNEKLVPPLKTDVRFLISPAKARKK